MDQLFWLLLTHRGMYLAKSGIMSAAIVLAIVMHIIARKGITTDAIGFADEAKHGAITRTLSASHS
jgi:hypothetical protein